MRILGGVVLFRQSATGLTLRDCPRLEVRALLPICVNVGWSAIKTLAAQINVGLCDRCVVRARMATTSGRAAPDDNYRGVRDVEACQPDR